MIIKATNIGKPKYTYGIIGLTQEEYDYILEAVNSSDNRNVDDKCSENYGTDYASSIYWAAT